MAFGVDDALLISGVLSAGAGFFGRNTSNPNERFANSNDPFYQTAMKNYYNSLSKTLAANTPGKATMFAMQTAGGGAYGGSTHIANTLYENELAKNRDVAGNEATKFGTNLYTRGMELWAGGEMANYEDTNSFANQLLSLGGGLISRYFNKGGKSPFDSNLPYNGFPPITF